MPTGAGRPDAEPAVTILARLPSTMRAPPAGDEGPAELICRRAGAAGSMESWRCQPGRHRHHVLAGLAHQPYLESASTVAQLIRSAVTEG